MSGSQEANLKKVLTFKDCLGLGWGQIIGAGVMVLTGLGIGLTGKGIIYAFIVSGICTFITLMPLAQLASALPTTGGAYRYTTHLLSPKCGFLWVLGLVMAKIGIALYALSFAQYFQGLWPQFPVNTVAIVMITTLYVINLVGIRTASTFENLMVVLKVSAILLFVLFGLPHINFSDYVADTFLPKGNDGLLACIALFAWSTGGAAILAELGGEMKNPGRDIPLSIMVTTIGAGLFYVLVGIVATGVLPVGEVAGKPLTEVAKVILPQPLFYFFMIGGALIAMLTTTNASFAWVTKGMLISCQDGWLPASFGAVSKRFGTPHWLLTFFWGVGTITIISGISMVDIAKIGSGVMIIIQMIPVYSCYYLIKKYPEKYEEAYFKIPPKLLYTTITVSLMIQATQVYWLFRDLPRYIIVGIFIALAACILYVNIVGNNPRFKDLKQRPF
jgi:Amino acid transporters